MANYSFHAKFNSLFALPLLIFGLLQLDIPSPNILFFTGSFLYSTLFMNPDMDLAGSIKLFSLRGLFTLPFRLYSLFFHHRGISHNILLGSLTRIAWLFLSAFILLYFLQAPFCPILEFISNRKEMFSYLFLGIFLADLIHIGIDQCKKI